MEKIVDVAQYVYKYYLKETDEKIAIFCTT